MARFTHRLRTLAASLGGLGLVFAAAPAAALPETDLMISEVFFDVAGGGDDRRQWVELYNAGPTDITLTGNYSLGMGRDDYTRTVIDLIGVIGAGDIFVVGGDISDGLNFNPVLDQSLDFNPNMRRGNHNARSDGIALFTGPASSIAQGSDPIHALIYGEATSGPRPWLTDETGAINSGSLDVVLPTSGIAGQSLSFDGTNWFVSATPDPTASTVPEPGSAVLLAIGLFGLALVSRQPRRFKSIRGA